MLSLTPRLDLFRFVLPKEFLPKEIEEKYSNIFYTNSSVITSPIDYLNESIIGISFPGIADINITQDQHGSNDIRRVKGKINVEPKHEIVHVSTDNPLEKIDKEFKVTFRLNQGLYNYFMIYETIFHIICKPILKPSLDFLYVDILNENGNVTSRIKFMDCFINGIDGLDFEYTKVDRDPGTFQVSFRFNNIDFEFIK